MKALIQDLREHASSENLQQTELCLFKPYESWSDANGKREVSDHPDACSCMPNGILKVLQNLCWQNNTLKNEPCGPFNRV